MDDVEKPQEGDVADEDHGVNMEIYAEQARRAARDGDVARLQLLNNTALGSLTTPNEDGHVASHAAAQQGQLDAFRFICDARGASHHQPRRQRRLDANALRSVWS